MKLRQSLTTGVALTLVGLPLFLVACSASDDGPAGLAGAGNTAGASSTIDTGVPGEQFAALEVSPTRLTGVFTKDGEALAFDVDHRSGKPVLRFSSPTGEVLYSVVNDDGGYELRVGAEFRGYLPKGDERSPTKPNERTATPSGFEVKGDLHAALEQMKDTALRHVTALAAALGRVGVDGQSSPISLSLHLTAEQLTQDLKLQLDPGVLELTNEMIAGHASKAPTDDNAPPTTTAPRNPGLVQTEGLAPGPSPLPTCRRAPCAAGQTVVASGPLAGCCITPTPPAPNPDYSATPACHSGVGRQQFSQLSPLDPCRDSCLGMCGPGCDPWTWVCGDTAVHAACWNHDRAYCNATINVGWGISLPNPDYPACMVEYAAYTTAIFAETVPGPFCGNTAWADAVSQPWWGLPAARASYFVSY